MKFCSQELVVKLTQITENKQAVKRLTSTLLQYTVYIMITGLTETKLSYSRSIGGEQELRTSTNGEA